MVSFTVVISLECSSCDKGCVCVCVGGGGGGGGGPVSIVWPGISPSPQYAH